MFKLVLDLAVWVWEDKRKRWARVRLLGFVAMGFLVCLMAWGRVQAARGEWQAMKDLVITTPRLYAEFNNFKQAQEQANNRQEWKINALLVARGIDPGQVERRADRAWRRMSRTEPRDDTHGRGGPWSLGPQPGPTDGQEGASAIPPEDGPGSGDEVAVGPSPTPNTGGKERAKAGSEGIGGDWINGAAAEPERSPSPKSK